MAYDVKGRVKDIRRPKKTQHGGITKVYTYHKVSQKRKHVEDITTSPKQISLLRQQYPFL